MMYIEGLEEKLDEIKDSDIMVIEDSEDTKKITVGNLKKAITVSSDKKIESVKETIIKEVSDSDQVITQKVKTVENAYYALVRNYEFLNSAYEELKEMFYDYINRVKETVAETIITRKSVPVITDISTSDSSVTLVWEPVPEADGYIVAQTYVDEQGETQTDIIEDTKISNMSTATALSNIVTATFVATEMKIVISDLEVGKQYTFIIIAYKYDEDGNRIDTYSTEKEIICK